jgi:dephospho-CoA kinase
MPAIALTGGFGMGKTTVLNIFGKLGARTVDIDDIVHEILGEKEFIKKFVSILGDDILYRGSGVGSINKRSVADIIFSSPEKRRTIEDMIHPEVFKRIITIKKEALRESPSALIVFEVPLLFETGHVSDFDKTIVVYCKRDIAIKRLGKKGFSRKEAAMRMRAQLPIKAKKEAADFVIDNSDGVRMTEDRVRSIFYMLSATV